MNPAQEVEKHVFVVLGATGDLTARKLLPAVYHLSAEGYLKQRCIFLGVARRDDLDDISFRKMALDMLERSDIPAGERAGSWCNDCMFYHGLGDGTIEDFKALRQKIESIESDRGLPGNRVFYLALPPSAFGPAIRMLGEAGLDKGPGWTRLVVEKPFGRDLESAKRLNSLISGYFGEDKIYRIDHFMGKETVQNLLVFRFANSIFESLWNRDRVESVQITVAENLGVAGRGAYYDSAGAIRDMVQNHLTQLVSLVAMDAPAGFDAEIIRVEKIKVLRAIQALDPGRVVMGRYGAGSINGSPVSSYLDETGVGPDSSTESFVAMRLDINNWRWQGVPFYLRTGKGLAKKLTRIAIVFKRPPVCIFEPYGSCSIRSNVLYITLQPDESFTLTFDVKSPGESMILAPQELRFSYKEAFGRLPDAYEALLLDIITGDQTLFVHMDEVEASWKLFTPVLEAGIPVEEYKVGSWGPGGADTLVAKDGFAWMDL